MLIRPRAETRLDYHVEKLFTGFEDVGKVDLMCCCFGGGGGGGLKTF
jgi:hypothetical protein